MGDNDTITERISLRNFHAHAVERKTNLRKKRKESFSTGLVYVTIRHGTFAVRFPRDRTRLSKQPPRVGFRTSERQRARLRLLRVLPAFRNQGFRRDIRSVADLRSPSLPPFHLRETHLVRKSMRGIPNDVSSAARCRPFQGACELVRKNDHLGDRSSAHAKEGSR